jgi:predicted  nucleic acid-binding Zn-ribbon protein
MACRSRKGEVVRYLHTRRSLNDDCARRALNDEVNALNDEVNALNDEVNALNDECDSLTDELVRQDREIAELGVEVAASRQIADGEIAFVERLFKENRELRAERDACLWS